MSYFSFSYNPCLYAYYVAIQSCSRKCNFPITRSVRLFVAWLVGRMVGCFVLYDPILSVVNLKLFVQKTFKMTMIIIVRCYLSRYLAI